MEPITTTLGTPKISRLILFALVGVSVPAYAAHPKLICTRSQFAAMISSSTSSPWVDMMRSAEEIDHGPWGGAPHGSSWTPQERENQAIINLGVNSLLYILNSNNSGSITYRTRVKQYLNDFPDMWKKEKDNGPDYGDDVPMNGTFFQAVIALDIIYDDLTPTERTTYETVFSSYAAWNQANLATTAWRLSNRGADALWAIYVDSSPTHIAYTTTAFHNDLIKPGGSIDPQLGLNGSFGEGALYGGDRLAGSSYEKICKWGFINVAQFTGKASYFGNTALKNFYEWRYSGGVNPFGWRTVFGDTNNDYPYGNDFFNGTLGINYTVTDNEMMVGNFSARAAGWASRFALAQPKPLAYPHDVMAYNLATGPLVASQPSVSLSFHDQGAVLWDDAQTTDALQGILWNSLNTRGSHLHLEQNGLYLAGYGEVLMTGPGYYFGNIIITFSDDWAKYSSHPNSVLEFNNESHDGSFGSHGGEGITEFLASPRFDYASGYSTSAYTGSGEHQRNFFFVHPANGANGYWVVMDEAKATYGPSVNTLWHPYSPSMTTTTASTEWAWDVSNRKAPTTTTLSVFLGTPPTSVSFSSGAFQGGYGGGRNMSANLLGQYLNAKYNVDSSSNARIATILYPSDATHAKATMARIAPSGATGATVTSGGVVDYVLISSPSADVVQAGTTYNGRGSVFRRVAGVLVNYFVRQGTKFDDGAGTRTGFASLGPVSIHMLGLTGSIVSPGTDVTIYSPGITGVLVDGSPASGTQGTDSFGFVAGYGTHTLAISSATVVVPPPPVDSPCAIFTGSCAIL